MSTVTRSMKRTLEQAYPAPKKAKTESTPPPPPKPKTFFPTDANIKASVRKLLANTCSNWNNNIDYTGAPQGVIPGLDEWGTSNITDMSDLFNVEGGLRDCTKDGTKINIFEDPSWNITEWDVSNVTTMARMFRGASYFNQPIGGWKVGNVRDMSDMFANIEPDEEARGEGDVGAVVFPHDMKFNQNINEWDVENVRTAAGMFYGYNQAMEEDNMSKLAGKNALFEEHLGNFDWMPIQGGKRRSRQRKTRKTRKTRRNKRKSTRRNRRR
jgi:hypothetical protein